uniref:LRR receptor-like serine/threonine-protein kinase n=1 Tax=Heterorhabditis bacteriophora TaxID=37862 RepID=A0A1I7WSJ1_HETBA
MKMLLKVTLDDVPNLVRFSRLRTVVLCENLCTSTPIRTSNERQMLRFLEATSVGDTGSLSLKALWTTEQNASTGAAILSWSQNC